MILRANRSRGWASGLLICAAVGTATQAHAGAWTQPEGGYYVRFAAAGIQTATRFDGDGRRVPYRSFSAEPQDAEYRNYELRGYGEYGTSDHFTIYGSLAIKNVQVNESLESHENGGLGDLYAGGRLRLARGPIPLSLAGELKLPTIYDPDRYPALGAGQVDAVGRVLAGVSGNGWYATGDLGWMARTGAFRDQALANFEFGGQIAGRYGGRGVVRWAESVGGADKNPTPEGFDPVRASPRMLMLEGVLSVRVGPTLALEAGVTHMLSGRESLAGNQFELALSSWGVLPR